MVKRRKIKSFDPFSSKEVVQRYYAKSTVGGYDRPPSETNGKEKLTKTFRAFQQLVRSKDYVSTSNRQPSFLVQSKSRRVRPGSESNKEIELAAKLDISSSKSSEEVKLSGNGQLRKISAKRKSYLSKKKEKRKIQQKQRVTKQEANPLYRIEDIPFGQVADRPPSFIVVPRHKNKSTILRKELNKRNNVVSS